MTNDKGRNLISQLTIILISSILFRFRPSSFGFSQDDTLVQSRHGDGSSLVLVHERFFERLTPLRLAMHQEDALLGPAHLVKPVEQLAVVRMAGVGVEDLNARVYLE